MRIAKSLFATVLTDCLKLDVDLDVVFRFRPEAPCGSGIIYENIWLIISGNRRSMLSLEKTLGSEQKCSLQAIY